VATDAQHPQAQPPAGGQAPAGTQPPAQAQPPAGAQPPARGQAPADAQQRADAPPPLEAPLPQDAPPPPEAPARRGPLRLAGRAAAILVAAGFVALLAYGISTKSPNTSIDDSIRGGHAVAAPGFTLPVLLPGVGASAGVRAAERGGSLSLARLRGAAVILNFWASWCVPCRDEVPVLERFWRAQRARGAVVLGLDMQDVTDDARAFARGLGMTYPAVRDRGNDVARRYGTTGIPETFFISASGRVVGHVIGVVSAAQLASGLAAARAGRPLGVRRGGARRATRR
jgi:cytochrome c biogenesis protein CcmG/thiol:disulfide interchange protein DsbE